MSDEVLMRTVVTGAVLCLIYFLVMFVFTGYGTAFYQDCSRIMIGMSKQQVLTLMQKYTNDPDNYNYGEQNIMGKSIGWDTLGPLNDYQCSVGLNQADRVITVTPIFD
jgi:hypothetical protein